MSPYLSARRGEVVVAGLRSSCDDMGFLSLPEVDNSDDKRATRIGERERGEEGRRRALGQGGEPGRPVMERRRRKEGWAAATAVGQAGEGERLSPSGLFHFLFLFYFLAYECTCSYDI